MVLIGIGPSGALGPFTAVGSPGFAADDAGAASGLAKVAHPLGCILGLRTLVTVFAATRP